MSARESSSLFWGTDDAMIAKTLGGGAFDETDLAK